MIERNSEIVRLYRRGITMEAIGERFAISKQRVKQILVKVGEPTVRLTERGGRAKRDPFTETELAIGGCHAEGYWPADIAARLGVTVAEVNLALQRLGLKRHGRGPRFDTPTRRATDAKIVQLYLGGAPTSRIIATVDGVNNYPRIYRALKRVGVKPLRAEAYSRFGRN